MIHGVCMFVCLIVSHNGKVREMQYKVIVYWQWLAQTMGYIKSQLSWPCWRGWVYIECSDAYPLSPGRSVCDLVKCRWVGKTSSVKDHIILHLFLRLFIVLVFCTIFLQYLIIFDYSLFLNIIIIMSASLRMVLFIVHRLIYINLRI